MKPTHGLSFNHSERMLHALVQVVEGTFKDGFLNGPGRVTVMNLDSPTGEAPKLTVSQVCGGTTVAP